MKNQSPKYRDGVREVGMREFQLNASAEMNKGLPIVLVKHDVAVAYVVAPSPLKEQMITQEVVGNIERPLKELTNMLYDLKRQKYPERQSLNLAICKTHGVYQATCNCNKKK